MDTYSIVRKHDKEPTKYVSKHERIYLPGTAIDPVSKEETGALRQATECRAGIWQTRWQRHNNADQLHQALTELRQAALEELPHRSFYDIDDLEAALAKFKPTTARGADPWQPPEIKALPHAAKKSILFLMSSCERKLCWPHHFYHVWYHFLV